MHRLDQQQRITKSTSRKGLVPGRDGSLITSDGDLAHMGVKTQNGKLLTHYNLQGCTRFLMQQEMHLLNSLLERATNSCSWQHHA